MSKEKKKDIFEEWLNSADHIFYKLKILRHDNETSEIFKLPEIYQFFVTSNWKIDHLILLKDKLNETKSRLDNYETDPWHRHTRTMNPAYSVAQMLRSRFNPEYCSQAWGKFMEILSQHPIIPQAVFAINDDEGRTEFSMNSIHLCEAPGAFISATNHYIKTNYPGTQWNWLGTTLNPYHEGNDVGQMINEDKLIQRCPNKWTFLQDNTGNIINRQNIKSLARKATKIFKCVHFVTADGSIDCQNKPGEQEILVLQLQYAEIISALMILGKGGSFVIKIFTFFETSTICHLYLLSCVFKEVKLVKPSMSKEGNSEVYVICLDYIGRSEFEEELMVLLSHVGVTHKTEDGKPIPSDLWTTPFSKVSVPKFFIERIIDAAEFFVDIQISVIQRNIDTFPKRVHIYHKLKIKQNDVAWLWTVACNMQKLENNDRLFSTKNDMTCESLIHVDLRTEVGSFSDRQANNILTLINLNIIDEKLEVYKNMIKTEKFAIEIEEEYKIKKVTVGKFYINILGSRFCYGKLLGLRTQLRELIINHWDLVLTSSKEIINIPHCTIEENKIKLNPLVKKFPGIKSWKLTNICYHETLNDLVTKTDAEITLTGLKKFIEALENLDINGSIFLCEFPLLTRLHIGIIFAVTNCFVKVCLCYKREKNIIGILLYGFKGFEEKFTLHENLIYIIVSLGEGFPNQTVLECLDMRILSNGPHVKDLIDYNLINTTRSIELNTKCAKNLQQQN